MISAVFSGRRIRVIAAATALAVFCTLLVMASPPASALTLSEENELGRKILMMIRMRLPLVEDGEVLTYIRSVATRVATEIGTTPYKYQFFVIDLPIPNAFALPGGYIFMFRGLIEMMDTEGELAGIFAHELSHIQARHIQRQIDESKVLGVAAVAGMIAGLVLGVGGAGAVGQSLAAGSMAASQSMALRYSRGNEMEADQMGFRFLCAAGYDPVDMVGVMRKLDQMKWTGVSSVPTYLMSHPAIGERVLYLNEMVKKQKASIPQSKRPPVGDFHVMQAALIADHTDPAQARDRFLVGIKKGDRAAVFGLGRLLLRQGKVKEACTQLQEAARLMSSPFVLSSLGAVYHRLGRLEEAQKAFQSALVLDPSASIVHYRYALVLEDLGKRDEALEHLIQIEDMAPTFPEVDYQLGVLYGQKNRLAAAHYHLARYYENKQNLPLALMHYKKAKGYRLESAARIEEVNQSIKELEKDIKKMPVKR